MKIKFVMMAMIAALVFGATSVSAQKTRKKAKSAKITRVERNPQTYVGYVGEGTTMHTLELKTIGSKSKTMFIPVADNADLKNSHIVIGNVVVVVYKKEGDQIVATKITGSADYDNAIGRWTMADPINKTQRMGVELSINGVAKSINMATLPYTRWELQGKPGRLILFGQSIGNGQTFEEKTIVTIKKIKGVWKMLDSKGHVLYTKEKDL
jgi:hypothetical protein